MIDVQKTYKDIPMNETTLGKVVGLVALGIGLRPNATEDTTWLKKCVRDSQSTPMHRMLLASAASWTRKN